MGKYWQRGWASKREMEAMGQPVGMPDRGTAFGERLDPVTAMVGGSVASGLLGADAASSAADAQAEAARQSDATQRYFYDTARTDNAPFRQSGVAANNRLAYLLGLTPSATGGAAAGVGETAAQIRERLLPQFTRAAPAPAASAPVGWTFSTPAGNYSGGEAGAEERFSQAVSAAAPAAPIVDEAGLNSEIQRILNEQNTATQTAQQNALSDPQFGSLNRTFTQADLEADPVYQSGLQFGLEEGRNAINSRAAASGSFLSGATLKALTRFATDYASTKAADSRNRFVSDQDSRYNRLAGLIGAGQSATAQVGTAGMNAGNQIGASQQGAGNARAAGYIGGANALSGAFASGVSNYNGNRLLDLYQQRTTGGNTGLGTFSNDLWRQIGNGMPPDFTLD